MDALGLGDIHLKCDIPFIKLERLSCREKVNEHTTICARLLISDETVQWFNHDSLCERTLNIVFGDANSEQRLVGTISYAQWGIEEGVGYVDIRAESGTKKMDVDCKTFVFQKTDQNYGDFFKEISELYYGSCIILDEQAREERLRYPIVQYKETDWEFIKRVAFRRNLSVITDSRQKNPRYFLGNNKADIKAVGNYFRLEKVVLPEGEQIRISTYENYELGGRAWLFGKQMTVIEKHSVLRQGLLEYDYTLCNKNAYELSANIKNTFRGFSIRGSVLEARGERLKLKLAQGDERQTESLCSYDYLPATGNGMYSMPEEGAEVELYFPTFDTREAYVRNCFLPEMSYPDSNFKFIATPYKKLLEMSPAGIAWKAQSGSGENRIELKRTFGAVLGSSNRISLIADEDIMIQSGASCRIDAAGMVNVEQLDTINAIQLSGSRIKMSAEHYTVSSDPPKIKREKKEGLTFSMEEANQLVLAAIPMPVCDDLTVTVASSLPQILSADSFKYTEIGLFRIRRGG